MAASPKKLAPTPAPTPEPKMIDVVLHTLEDAKAEETVAIDIAGKSSLADNMVVLGLTLARQRDPTKRRRRVRA